MRRNTEVHIDTERFLEIDRTNRVRYIGHDSASKTYGFEYCRSRDCCKIFIPEKIFESGELFNLMKFQFKTLQIAPNQVLLQYSSIKK